MRQGTCCEIDSLETLEYVVSCGRVSVTAFFESDSEAPCHWQSSHTGMRVFEKSCTAQCEPEEEWFEGLDGFQDRVEFICTCVTYMFLCT